MKLTKWSKPGEKPVRIGVYQTKVHENDSSEGYQYWDGKSWRFWGDSPEDAYYCRVDRTGFNQKRIAFRGLAEKPC